MSIRIIALLSMGAFVSLAGCGGPPAAPPAAEDHAGHDHAAEAGHAAEEAGAHDHGAAGPHGGDVVVLGDEEYHAEIVHDEAGHTVTVYLLDAAIKAPVQADAAGVTLQVFLDGKFVDYPLAPAGADASQYQVEDEKLVDALAHAEELRGRLHVTIGGQKYTGTITHAAHDHDHGVARP